MLILVRHALPAASPDVPADEWELTPEGHAEAEALIARLPRGAKRVASTEPKAWQTLGDKLVIRDRRFGEVAREAEPWSDAFRVRRAAYVGGEALAGWEPHDEVAERFQRGVDAYLDDDRDLVVGTHGMVLTTWLVSIGAVAPDAAAGFWESLAFPDAYVVDLETPTVDPYNGSVSRPRR